MEETNTTFSKEEFNSFVKDALSKIEKINQSYIKFFESSEGKDSAVMEIESNLIEIKKEYENLFNNNDSGISKISELNNKIESIKTYHKQLLEGDESISSGIKESQDKITDFYVYLFGGSDGTEGQEKFTKEAIEKITTFHSELIKEDGYEELIENTHKRIMDLYNELFDKGELEESKVEALNKEIQNIKDFNKIINTETKDFIANTTIDIETKSSEINSLLSNATVRTLAQGYLESMQNHGFTGLKNVEHNKNESKKEILILELLNYASSFFKWLQNSLTNLLNYTLFILPLLLIGVIFIEPNFVKIFLEVDSLGGTKLMGIQYIYYKISVSLPLLWISWYGQKNISHRKRLFEEYNHKLRVVQMYLLFISKDKSYSLNNMARLEEILLDVIDRNPAEVYGKDETFLDKIIEAMKTSKDTAKDIAEKIKKSDSLEN